MRKKFITAALPYVNNKPHLGNIIGALLSADVTARYFRMRKYETIFVSGTDEYGTATMMEALRQKVKPEEIVLKNRKIHQEIYKYFDISFDHFGHTFSSVHDEITKEFFLRISKYFDINKADQFFCSNCSQFLADRYVRGKCNHCGGDAYADQCEVCSKLLDFSELLEPKCKLCGEEARIKQSEHLYLRLDVLKEKIRNQSTEGWSKNAIDIYNDWMSKEIKQRSMTRDMSIKWGVQVPIVGFENKVFYVWFDAPIGYFTFLSHIKDLSWLEDADFIQFMGKDNVPFHSVIFPCMVEALRDSLKENIDINTESGDVVLFNKQKVKRIDKSKYSFFDECVFNFKTTISATEYLTFGGEKFSKSKEIGIFGTDLISDKLGDVSKFRAYLIARRPEIRDVGFNIPEFIQWSDKQLIGNIGNLVNRVNNYLKKRKIDVLSEIKKLESLSEIDCEKIFIADCQEIYKDFLNLMEKLEIRQSFEMVLKLGNHANGFIQNLQNRPESRDLGFALVHSVIIYIGMCLFPFVPKISEDIFKQCNYTFEMFPDGFEILEHFNLSETINIVVHPFSKSQIEELNNFILE